MSFVDQFYQDANGGVHFLSAQDQENAIANGLALPDPAWTLITPEQAQTATSLTPAQLWANYQGEAQAALDASDTTMLRVSEAIALGLNTTASADVIAFVGYRRALRAIVSAETGTPGALPVRPAYPAGT